MSRLPENKDHQQNQKQKSHQAGEASGAADGDTIRKVVDSGPPAAHGRDFRALYANVSEQPFDKYHADEHKTAAVLLASAVEQERDKNLSEVVRSIQDEGPPDYQDDSWSESGTAWQDEVAPGGAGLEASAEGHQAEPDSGSAWIKPRFEHERSSRKLTIYGLLLGILVILAILVIIGAVEDGGKEFPSPAELSRVPGEEAQPAASTLVDNAADARLQEIQGVQQRISARLGELESDIATLSQENSRQRVANEVALDAIRVQQQREQALLTGRIDALQKQVATQPVAVALPEVAAEDPAASAAKSVTPPGGDGDWTVNLASFSREEQARKLLGTLKRAGIPVEQQTASLNGDTRYRLRVTGFSSRDEARQYAGKLDKGLGLGEPWVSRR